MALAKQKSAAVDGVRASTVNVEVDVSDGLPSFTVVGLADKAVEESRERVRSALKHSGYKFPLSRITVNLTPSNQKKSGIHFDLPIALSILQADKQLEMPESMNETLIVGGLSLDGALQPFPGALILVDWAKQQGIKRVVLPWDNYYEAALIGGIELVPLKNFNELVELIFGRLSPTIPTRKIDNSIDQFAEDWLQIQGQAQAKRAALISAAGGHNILLEGAPGTGKTLLAKGMRALLPPLTRDELIEVVKLHCVASVLPGDKKIDSIGRPFRSPHHTASHVAVVGGGSSSRPGEISLAHNGILFLDELPEFQRPVIEALRQPLEDGEIFVTRVEQSAHYPARFIFVATMNPCPCGWLGSNQKDCKCSPYQVTQYRKKISGPILDRIDLCIHVPSVSLDDLKGKNRDTEELNRYRDLVKKAREKQLIRNGGELNAKIPGRKVNELFVISPDAEHLIKRASEKLVLTGRSYHKLLKVAQTITDLSDQDTISSPAVAEALQYRFSDF